MRGKREGGVQTRANSNKGGRTGAQIIPNVSVRMLIMESTDKFAKRIKITLCALNLCDAYVKVRNIDSLSSYIRTVCHKVDL